HYSSNLKTATAVFPNNNPIIRTLAAVNRDLQILFKHLPLPYRAEVPERDGGYLIATAHITQTDTSPETIRIMIEAAKE
ncbi:MAG: hypothetical protein GY801_05225, partial [bacterium]|nr:hypothetical protein [bacterium]